MGLYVPFAGDNGIDGLADENSDDVNFLVTAFLAISLYNAVELIVLIYLTFKRRNTLYFWSISCTNFFGVWTSAIVYIFYYFEVSKSDLFAACTLPASWIFLVTGHSLVLYSRLHLVIFNRKVLHAVLAMIIVDAILLHTTTLVLLIGTYAEKASNGRFLDAYGVMEKVELTCFTVQETIISAVYIWFTARLLHDTATGQRRTALFRLIAVNIIEILLNIALVVIEYLNLYIIQTTMKVMVYSIKLKLEFAVLNEIVRVSHADAADQVPDFVEASQLQQLSASDSVASPPPSKQPRRGSWFSGSSSVLETNSGQ
ncbi:hypothetical protein KEM55_005665 [Ascosphaera atra]|nr:hypothetical protein KEM55_005665 [Ascosphaera atra]